MPPEPFNPPPICTMREDCPKKEGIVYEATRTFCNICLIFSSATLM